MAVNFVSVASVVATIILPKHLIISKFSEEDFNEIVFEHRRKISDSRILTLLSSCYVLVFLALCLTQIFEYARMKGFESGRLK